MAEDEETATARYIAANVSTQLMLKTIIEIISTMADNPDKYRAGLRVKLLELADTMPLAAMAPAREDKVRAFVRETIGTLLTNKPLTPRPPWLRHARPHQHLERAPSRCWRDSKWEDAHFLGARRVRSGIGGGKRIVVADHCAES
jgi:hypothetical protein